MRKTINITKKLIFVAIAAAVLCSLGQANAQPPGGHTVIGYFSQPGDYTTPASYFRLYDISTTSAVANGTTSVIGSPGTYYTIGADGLNENVQNVAPTEETGDTVVVTFDWETDGGTVDHIGYYSITDVVLTATATMQVSWGDAPRQIPRPFATLNESASVELSWPAAVDGGSGNIIGYDLYRGTDGISFPVKVNGSVITDTSFMDTSAVSGSTYYYALKIVYRGPNSGTLDTLYMSTRSNPVTVGTPGVSIISVYPYWGFPGQTVDAVIIGSNTHFTATSEVRFEGINHVTATTVDWLTETMLHVVIDVDLLAELGPRNVVVQTGDEVAVGMNMFWVVTDEVTFVCNPASGARGGTGDVSLIGTDTHFDPGTSILYFGPDIDVNSLSVQSQLLALTNITISTEAILGTRVAIMQSGSEIAIGDFEVNVLSMDDDIIPNYPNPFDPNDEPTNIVIELDEPTEVGIYIYDVTARQVWKEVRYLDAGVNVVQWTGFTYYDKIADNGVYLLRVADEGNKAFIGKGRILVFKKRP